MSSSTPAARLITFRINYDADEISPEDFEFWERARELVGTGEADIYDDEPLDISDEVSA